MPTASERLDRYASFARSYADKAAPPGGDRGGEGEMKTVLRISDLQVGQRVKVRWYPGQEAVRGTVVFVCRNASRSSGSSMRTDAGQRVRLKASMTIEPE